MASPFHPGELAVQARVGVLAAATRVSGIIQSAIPAPAQAFLVGQSFAIVGTVDPSGRVWASLLAGEPGMLRVPDPHTLHIAAIPTAGDPLATTLASALELGTPADLGVLVIDLATRKRLRVNGTAESATDGGILVHVRQAYWNCPKYIQRRSVVARPDRSSGTPPPSSGVAPWRATRLTDAQRAWVGRADTFFIASVHPSGGADASHRGGSPGFVQLARGAAGEDMLVFPDYPGNNMFNTLGNLAVNPAAGLLFVDFESGATLQLTGIADVLWKQEQFAAWPGAERAVGFRVAQVVELSHDSPLGWRLIERSPFNPPSPVAQLAPGG